MKEKLLEYSRLITINQWGVASLTAFFGALSAGEFKFLPLFILAIIGVLATIFSSVFNDYCDLELDKLSKGLTEKPLVKGSIPKIHALYISVFAVIIAYIIILVSMYLDIFIMSIKPIIVVTLATILGTLYDLYGKKFVGSDILSGSAAALFCLFGAMIVSDTISSLTIVVVLLVFLQIFFLNAFSGGLKDADHDHLYGIKNLAYRMGVRIEDNNVTITHIFSAVVLLFRITSAFLLFIPIVFIDNFPYFLWQPFLMLLIIIGIFFSTFKMLRIKTFDRDQIRKMISIQEFLRYIIVPVMLLRFIGLYFGLFLIVFPFIWFIVFNRLIYGSALKPKRM
jgi:4-hydroxybenzoate polyprenyltransferase